VPSRKDNIDIIRGMALAAAAAVAKGEAVNTEVREDFDNEPLEVRVFIGNHSAVFRVNGADIDHLGGNGAVRMQVEPQVQGALSDLVR